MNKTWKIVFSSSLCFSNAHYFGCSFFLCLFLPLPLPLSLTSPIYLFVSPSVSALNSCSVTLGPRAQPWQTVAPSLESFLETQNMTLKQVISQVLFSWIFIMYYLFSQKNDSLVGIFEHKTFLISSDWKIHKSKF